MEKNTGGNRILFSTIGRGIRIDPHTMKHKMQYNGLCTEEWYQKQIMKNLQYLQDLQSKIVPNLTWVQELALTKHLFESKFP